MCRNYDGGECTEEGCTKRVTCQDNDDVCNDHDPWLNAFEEDQEDEVYEITVGENWHTPVLKFEAPAPKCECKHVKAHHAKVTYVGLSLVRGPDACSWAGCGCPFFVKA